MPRLSSRLPDRQPGSASLRHDERVDRAEAGLGALRVACDDEEVAPRDPPIGRRSACVPERTKPSLLRLGGRLRGSEQIEGRRRLHQRERVAAANFSPQKLRQVLLPSARRCRGRRRANANVRRRGRRDRERRDVAARELLEDRARSSIGERASPAAAERLGRKLRVRHQPELGQTWFEEDRPAARDCLVRTRARAAAAPRLGEFAHRLADDLLFFGLGPNEIMELLLDWMVICETAGLRRGRVRRRVFAGNLVEEVIHRRSVRLPSSGAPRSA